MQDRSTEGGFLLAIQVRVWRRVCVCVRKHTHTHTLMYRTQVYKVLKTAYLHITGTTKRSNNLRSSLARFPTSRLF